MFLYKNLSLQKTEPLLVNQFFLFLNYNLFHIDIPFLYPLKIRDYLTFSGKWKGNIGMNWVI